ncbi:hypothetical protein HID58_087370 [Brassica napus]|uniref:Uncharacterized protein n=1 Tax=Brassica napus TaxID=3708 RepID=A0ABQ7XUG1_BRANA|nr:hypothetical protein HID58_087370 [Brassica napus]
MVPKVGYHSYMDDTGVEAGIRSSSPGEPTRVTVELAGEHNHTTVQLAGERTGAMVELAGRVQPHDGSARRRADRRDARRRADPRDGSALRQVAFVRDSLVLPAPKEEKVTEFVLGLPASSATPLTKSRKRTGAATETVKKMRCTAGAEGEPSGPLSQHRVKAFWVSSGPMF